MNDLRLCLKRKIRAPSNSEAIKMSVFAWFFLLSYFKRSEDSIRAKWQDWVKGKFFSLQNALLFIPKEIKDEMKDIASSNASLFGPKETTLIFTKFTRFSWVWFCFWSENFNLFVYLPCLLGCRQMEPIQITNRMEISVYSISNFSKSI